MFTSLKTEFKKIHATGFEPSIVEPWKLLHLDYSTKGRALLLEKVLKEISVDRYYPYIHILPF